MTADNRMTVESDWYWSLNELLLAPKRKPIVWYCLATLDIVWSVYESANGIDLWVTLGADLPSGILNIGQHYHLVEHTHNRNNNAKNVVDTNNNNNKGMIVAMTMSINIIISIGVAFDNQPASKTEMGLAPVLWRVKSPKFEHIKSLKECLANWIVDETFPRRKLQRMKGVWCPSFTGIP